MVNKRYSLGILVLALVFAIAGCDNNPTGEDDPPDGPTALGEEPVLSGQVYIAQNDEYLKYTGPVFTVTSSSGGETGHISGNGQFSITLGTPDDLIDLDDEFLKERFDSWGDFENPRSSETGVKVGIALFNIYISDSASPSYFLSRGLSSQSSSYTGINSTSQSLMYVYVDKDVTISATGITKEESFIDEGGGIATYTTRDCELVLEAGWNTVLYQHQINVSIDVNFTRTVSAKNPGSLKWILWTYSNSGE